MSSSDKGSDNIQSPALDNPQAVRSVGVRTEQGSIQGSRPRPYFLDESHRDPEIEPEGEAERHGTARVGAGSDSHESSDDEMTQVAMLSAAALRDQIREADILSNPLGCLRRQGADGNNCPFVIF